MKENSLFNLLFRNVGFHVIHVALPIKPTGFDSKPVDHVELEKAEVKHEYFARPYESRDTSLF